MKIDKSQLRVGNKFLLVSAIVVGLVLIPPLILPMLANNGKIKGNKSTLDDCKNTLRIWKSSSTNSSQFYFGKLSYNDTMSLLLWAEGLNVFAKTNFTWRTSEFNREIVLVYGKGFSNVPKSPWTFFLKNPAHAVAYSDGTVGLISPEEFTNFNFNGFISFTALATNSDFNIYK